VHRRSLDSDLRIALVRHPDFAKKVRSIVVEFASTTEVRRRIEIAVASGTGISPTIALPGLLR